jgi:hypothetical protein
VKPIACKRAFPMPCFLLQPRPRPLIVGPLQRLLR